MKNIFLSLSFAIVSANIAVSAHAQSFSADDLMHRTIQWRAVEVVN